MGLSEKNVFAHRFFYYKKTTSLSKCHGISDLPIRKQPQTIASFSQTTVIKRLASLSFLSIFFLPE